MSKKHGPLAEDATKNGVWFSGARAKRHKQAKAAKQARKKQRK